MQPLIFSLGFWSHKRFIGHQCLFFFWRSETHSLGLEKHKSSIQHAYFFMFLRQETWHLPGNNKGWRRCKITSLQIECLPLFWWRQEIPWNLGTGDLGCTLQRGHGEFGWWWKRWCNGPSAVPVSCFVDGQRRMVPRDVPFCQNEGFCLDVLKVTTVQESNWLIISFHVWCCLLNLLKGKQASIPSTRSPWCVQSAHDPYCGPLKDLGDFHARPSGFLVAKFTEINFEIHFEESQQQDDTPTRKDVIIQCLGKYQNGKVQEQGTNLQGRFCQWLESKGLFLSP